MRILVGVDDEYYNGEAPQDDAYYINDELAVGRVEMCIDGEWGIVCEDYWQYEDASVACYQLGFARAGKNYILTIILYYVIYENFSFNSPGAIAGGEQFQPESENQLPIHRINITCTGQESSLGDCDSQTVLDPICEYSRNAYIACQGK